MNLPPGSLYKETDIQVIYIPASLEGGDHVHYRLEV
jgi:hypothetical protein